MEMNRRYEPQRRPNNSNIHLRKSPSGLQVVDLSDVPPVLDAHDRPDNGGLAVWCRYCLKWHLHGAGEGCRVAHCDKKDSPYTRSGYTLRAIGRPVPLDKNRKLKPPAAGQGR